MSNGYVQAPPDSTGKLVDAELLTVNGNSVERLRVAVPGEVKVAGSLLELLLIETQTTNSLLAKAFGLDADSLRQQETT